MSAPDITNGPLNDTPLVLTADITLEKALEPSDHDIDFRAYHLSVPSPSVVNTSVYDGQLVCGICAIHELSVKRVVSFAVILNSLYHATLLCVGEFHLNIVDVTFEVCSIYIL